MEKGQKGRDSDHGIESPAGDCYPVSVISPCLKITLCYRETGGKMPKVSSMTKRDARKNANTIEITDNHLLKRSAQAITTVITSPSPGKRAIKKHANAPYL